MMNEMVMILILAVMALIPACIVCRLIILYRKASKLLNEGKYKAAAEAFCKLGSFANAKKMSRYADAQADAESGNYLAASIGFMYLGKFKDSVLMDWYCSGRGWEAKGNYNRAVRSYKPVSFFKDSQERIAKLEIHAYCLSSGFSEGLACVINRDGKKGFIDTTGKLVIPCEWDDAGSFHEGLAFVKKDKFKKNTLGFINTRGELVIPCEWDGVWSFSEISTRGELIIPGEWHAGWVFSESLATVQKDEKCCYRTTEDKSVIPRPYEYRWKEEPIFSEGFAVVRKDEKYYYINTEGKPVIPIPCEWKKVTLFSEGFARVAKDNKWGFIDTTGKLVIPCILDWVAKFRDGYARVKKDGEHGIIDKTDKLVSDFDWYHVAYGEGHYIVEKNDIVEKNSCCFNGYVFIYDASGKKVF